MAELKLGNIKPVGADNVVVESKYVKGSYVVVSSIAERDALKGSAGENIIEGSLCYCTADSKFYQYDGTTWAEKEFGMKEHTHPELISCGTADPSASVTSQFYFKYTTE